MIKQLNATVMTSYDDFWMLMNINEYWNIYVQTSAICCCVESLKYYRSVESDLLIFWRQFKIRDLSEVITSAKFIKNCKWLSYTLFLRKCYCDDIWSYSNQTLITTKTFHHTWNIYFIYKRNETWKETYLRPMISYVQNTRIVNLLLSAKTLHRPKRMYPINVTTLCLDEMNVSRSNKYW